MKPIINLPFGESLKRTYLYVFANFGKAMKICSFWIVLMLAADVLMSFPSQCREGQNCIGWQSNVSMLLSVIASAAVSVSFARTVILKEEYDWFRISLGVQPAYLAVDVGCGSDCRCRPGLALANV